MVTPITISLKVCLVYIVLDMIDDYVCNSIGIYACTWNTLWKWQINWKGVWDGF